jgi:hypothetical protein
VKNGLSVDLVYFQGGSQVIQAMLYLEAALRLRSGQACELPVVERTLGKDFQRPAKHQRRHCDFTLGCPRLFGLTPSLSSLPFMVQSEWSPHGYSTEVVHAV